MEPLNVRMNLPLIRMLQEQSDALLPGHPMAWRNLPEVSQPALPELLLQARDEAIAVYDGGEWTVEDFIRYLPTVNPASLQKGIYAAVAMSLRNYFLLCCNLLFEV